MVPPGSPEHLQYLAECMGSAGFNVNIEAGGISANPPAEQQSFYRDALAQCEQAAIDAGLVAEAHPPDEAELAAWYAAFLLTYECLLENGYPSPQPPSVETYVESRGQNWHPYELIRPSVVGAAESACPQDLVILFEMLASSSAP